MEFSASLFEELFHAFGERDAIPQARRRDGGADRMIDGNLTRPHIERRTARADAVGRARPVAEVPSPFS
jgi:hypothetical protein